jgi:hypothetical protein
VLGPIKVLVRFDLFVEFSHPLHPRNATNSIEEVFYEANGL